MSTGNDSLPSSVAAQPSAEIVSLESGSYALKVLGRAGRPIMIYGFRTIGEAEAWYGRMEPRNAD
jgi:hypothetical protein